ncbi:FtsW/RodA/SpoVE family cell cycle protein [Oribacterium sp. WCC10]|uniref:FtsW/RodA/SpoVE family cell cycle protein n=1 Tax=Oribacterium sp. WCC10 TaxID=1855343 RepID=UPI0008F33A12|nr:FtsW/RodA/SpoVE family cell cycle protein [Oribacterium sp. WCC10]SFG08307.1 rod shape determining protein RodA [Oribacterium sp. WCC10]
MKFDYNLKNYDYRLLLYMVTLNILGVVIMRSAIGAADFRDSQVVRQIIGSFAGLIVCIVLSLIDYRRIVRQSHLIYLFSVLMLLGVKIYGTASGHGAVRWIQVPLLGQIQPAEFVKIGLIIFYAYYFHKAKDQINSPRTILIAFTTYLVPISLVLLQPNLSTAIIMSVIIMAIVFASNISYKWIVGVLLSTVPFVLFFVYLFKSGLYDRIPFLQGYQAERILTFLNPSDNSQTFYQQMYSIMAIGSGQFSGKGLNNDSIFSVKNGNFLAEEDNDFIFAVIGEELGFRGSIIIVIIFLLIIIECLIIASKAKKMSGRLICVGMMAWIGFQTYTNIAVATGIFPNTGITLPFFSRGASSLISVYIGMGLVLNVALQRRDGVV